MDSHGYTEFDDIDIVDHEAFAMRRGNPQTTNIHMTQMTTKVAPAYDGRTSFFAFEDAIDDWCDITELEAKKRGPALRNRQTRRRCSSVQTTPRQRNVERPQ